ncbi:MAG TPA: pseudouridine synthase [Planctomycetota bacterium]|nr:pseudouridine synthase [Planctomycetota bacterium]
MASDRPSDDRARGAHGAPPTAEEGEALGFDPETILYHGEGILAVAKPAGVPVHGSPGEERGLVELIRAWISLEPGVIDASARKSLHPITLLDKETSGVVILGLNRTVARKMKPLVSSFERRFVAVVAGPVPEAGRLSGHVREKGGEAALPKAEIEYRRLAGDERASLVEILPRTHRKHQIRVLFARKSRPIAGDLRYGKKAPVEKFREKYGIDRLLLHLAEISLAAPESERKLRIVAPIPPELLRFAAEKGWPRHAFDSFAPDEPSGADDADG